MTGSDGRRGLQILENILPLLFADPGDTGDVLLSSNRVCLIPFISHVHQRIEFER